MMLKKYWLMLGTLLHGVEEIKKAISTAKNIFEKKEVTANLPVISFKNNEFKEFQYLFNK